jgi:hypothetical protein
MGVITDFPIHDPLGIQPGYNLQVVDENEDPVTGDEFGGVSDTYQWIMPPQALQIRRSIRADVMKDLGSGSSVISGGEGLGRIQIQGTHGVGPQKDISFPTLGKVARDQLTAFFQAFLNANDERGRVGKPGLRMLFKIVGGKWSEPDMESYFVWPETFPADSRSAGRPHSWDWSASLIILSPYLISEPFDFSTLPTPQDLLSKATGLAALLQKAQALWKKFKAGLQKLKDLRNKLLVIAHRIADFVTGVKNAIYEVTDLIRGSAQLCSSILKSINPKDFLNTVSTAIRGTIYETRRFLGQAGLVSQSFSTTGATASSLTPGRTWSLSQPTSVGLSAGDTLQGIAARHLGGSGKWTDLVRVNGLEFPYLDFSGPGGRPDPSLAGKKVLGAQDILKLPLPVPPGIVALAPDPIGTDIPDLQVAANTLVGGTTNLAAAAIRRLMTPRGRVPWHPAYGSRLKQRIGTSRTLPMAAEIQQEVISVLKQDKRILNVGSVQVSLPDGGIVVTTSLVSPLGVVPISPSFAR